MNPDLAQLENFLAMLHELERVKRHARRPDERERTSTAEHTLEVALLAWHIASINKLDLDLGKVLMYALAHDLVEAYAGDVSAYDTEGRKMKAAREAAALERLKKEFPAFEGLFHALEAYEERKDEEANFVYAVDKLIDPLNMSMEKTQSIWKEYDLSFQTVIDYKQEKVAKHPIVLAYWQALVKKLEAKKDFFFHS